MCELVDPHISLSDLPSHWRVPSKEIGQVIVFSALRGIKPVIVRTIVVLILTLSGAIGLLKGCYLWLNGRLLLFD